MATIELNQIVKSVFGDCLSAHLSPIPASLVRRILAYVLDLLPGLFSLVICGYFFYLAWPRPSILLGGNVEIIPAILGIVALVAINMGYMLITLIFLALRSQSPGKFLLGIQITDFESGRPANPLQTIVYRYFLPLAIYQLPVIGPIATIADYLYGFGRDRRCLHDHIAKTTVTKVNRGRR